MFLPSAINLDASDKYKLIISITRSELAFTITGAQEDSHIFCFRSIAYDTQMSSMENIKKIIFDYSFFSLPFALTSIVFKDENYSCIPASFFEASKKEEVYNSIHQDKDNRIVLADGIEYRDIKILSSADKDLYNFLSRNLYQPQFSAHITPILQYLYNRNEVFARNMYVNINGKYMDVVCFQNKDLSYCETHITSSDDEKLYFILKVWEALDWNQSIDQLHLYGDASEFLSTQLSRYIKNKLHLVSPKPKGADGDSDFEKCPLDLIIMSL